MPRKYTKKHVDVYDLMSSDDESKTKVHFQLLEFDCHYVEKTKCLMLLVS